ncbi:MAG: hypothetical protein ABJE66_08915 [Deltaproteobacteria bacterium]
MKLRTLLGLFLMISGCGSSNHDAPTAGSADGSAAGSSSRPPAVTAEMAETYELYVVAFEKLTADIEKAGSDCKAALSVVQRDSKDVIAPLAPRLAKLATQDVKGDPAVVESWIAKTYTSRIVASSTKLKPLETACGGDADLRAAIAEAMSKFPFVHKKQ